MLNFAVKLISDAGFQHEISNVNTAAQQVFFPLVERFGNLGYFKTTVFTPWKLLFFFFLFLLSEIYSFIYLLYYKNFQLQLLFNFFSLKFFHEFYCLLLTKYLRNIEEV